MHTDTGINLLEEGCNSYNEQSVMCSSDLSEVRC